MVPYKINESLIKIHHEIFIMKIRSYHVKLMAKFEEMVGAAVV